VTLLLPLVGFLFISLLITAIGLSFLRGETAIERRLGELAEDRLEQRGLPGAVAPDQRDPPTRAQRDGHVGEEDALAVRFREA